ncbi:MAG: N-acetylmuramoyl-L-alanine amidase [Desulfobulbaceae bacterium]|jgi:N-acetylmuramoyl-L-alanine amidase|nr:N-acetylmuramoyl-L-alanine amidase [Desulfobulbaceae bacterium]MDY0349790.1 N-acetylmuramoyl-L-alanine amidase [Desulfobulbaceae bacterium]
MTPRNAADNVRLKSTILRGVYNENLRINSPRPDPASGRKGREGRRTALVFSVLLVLAVTVLFVRFFPSMGPDASGEPAAVASATASPVSMAPAYTSASLPSANLSFPVPQASYVMRPYDSLPQDFNTDRLLDYSLILNNDMVRLSSVFGLDVQTIVIDPGHGGVDPGAIGVLGTKEKDIVLDLAHRLRDKLMESGRYNVVLTREGDSTMSLAERVEFANSGRTDLFISLHVNALPQKRANVIETYYYGPPSDAETLRIAEQENKGSGILTRDFANMIRKIGNTFKEQESASLAAAIQHSLFTNVKKYDKDTSDAGIKIAPFAVLLGVDAPSVLVEISCISKKQEELKLNLPAYREEITSFIAEGTSRYLARRNLQVVKGEENDQKVRGKRS